MSKHTPERWVTDNNKGDNVWRVYLPFSKLNQLVAEVLGDSAEVASNARLIAAAPEMYELIENLSKAYDDRRSSHDLASTLYDLRCMALRLMDKIEGGGDNG